MCAVAAGVIALAPLTARAQDTTVGTTTGGMMTGTTTSGSMMSSAPMQVTGTVLRYYVDRSGYVTAMDVQTANGVQMVRFSPGMGQRVFSTYPVGGQANVWVMGGGTGGMTRYDVVGVGTDAPTNPTPYLVSDVALLDSQPYIMAGTQMVSVEGNLQDIITSDAGEVVGLVIRGARQVTGGHQGSGMMAVDTSAAGAGTVMTGMTGTMIGGDTLIRVPRDMRHISPGHMGSERVSPLFRNAYVWVTGWPEAPRYGALSRFGDRIAASAIVVNGRSVGPLGFPLMTREQGRTLFGWDVMANRSQEEATASTMGYSVYDPAMMGTGTGSMGGTGTTPGTTSTTGTTSP